MAVQSVQTFNTQFEEKYAGYADYAQNSQPAKTGANWLNAHYHAALRLQDNTKGNSLKQESNFQRVFNMVVDGAEDKSRISGGQRLSAPNEIVQREYRGEKLSY